MADKSKGMRLRLRAKSTSKILEKELKEKARILKKKPELILPICSGECSRCPFDKTRRSLNKVVAKADDKESLERLSQGGDKLARALAGFLLILYEDKIPLLALLKTPEGEIGYVQRGKAPSAMMAAVQYYDQPSIKALGYLDIIKKRSITMFITEKDLLCTGKDPTPPKAAGKRLRDEFKGKLTIKIDGGKTYLLCKHLDYKAVEDLKPQKVPYLRLSWDKGKLTIAICKNCAYALKGSSYQKLGAVVLTKKLRKEVTIKAQVSPLKKVEKGCPDIDFSTPNPIDYLQGEIDDYNFIKKTEESYREGLKEVGERVFIAGGICYGENLKKFLSSLNPSPEERFLLEEVLKDVTEPIVVEEHTTISILQKYWDKGGKRALAKVLKDKEIAESVFKEMALRSYTPHTIILEGKKMIHEKNLRRVLPEPIDPPEMINMIRELSIAYLSQGPEGVGRVLMRIKSDDIKTRAAVYAFIKALSLEKYSTWSYSPEEMGYAQGLEDVILKIVTEDPVKHMEGLKKLWQETGSTKELRFRKTGE